jgi:putative DNA methylase
MTYRKKLIEVALPLEAINMESAREKSIRHGHPSTLHLWWARRPLAACRAVLWSSLVDDPSSWPDRFPTEDAQKKERQRLFDILGRITIETDRKGNQKQVVRGLVSWNDINNPKSGVLEAAQREIARCLAWDRGEEPPTKPDAVREYIAKYAPPAYDPFAGGGSIPLEAQRLGLEAHASDLNPVAVLINKALIEIPPKFKNQAPVNPEDRQQIRNWKGAEGLAADVRHYGKWMRDEAFKRIGHLYPKINLPREYGGGEATVIAWLWARTVKCPNPACGVCTPLLSSLVLASKKGRESYLLPQVKDKEINFSISKEAPKAWGDPKKGLKRGMSGVFECVACGTVTTRNYVAKEAKAKRLNSIQTAVVVEGKSGRRYLPAEFSICPDVLPSVDLAGLESELSPNPRDIWCRNFGLNTPADLFSNRQLVALTTFSDLVKEAQKKAISDAERRGFTGHDLSLNDGGSGAKAYGEAISTYLAFGIDRMLCQFSTLSPWSSHPAHELVITMFARQAISMAWDYGEINPFCEAASWLKALELIPKFLERNNINNLSTSIASQKDVTQIVTSQ